MMFRECRGPQYYEGHVGTESRHPTARPGLGECQSPAQNDGSPHYGDRNQDAEPSDELMMCLVTVRVS
jgi:hypothetical protein